MSSVINEAAIILAKGGLVAFPTETVYGLGADAQNEEAVKKIFRVKERPFDHPLIVHIGRIKQLCEWARDVSPAALKLAQSFWPGPLTLILQKQPYVLDSVTGGQETIGIRIPSHPVALKLLQTFDGGIAAPSANKFTHLSPTRAEAVREELGDEVDMILDGGPCAVGLESTIIDMSRDVPRILRPGMITAEEIEKVLNESVETSNGEEQVPRTAGMHHVHYAPTTPTKLLNRSELLNYIEKLKPTDFPIACVTNSHIKLPSYSHIKHIHLAENPQNFAHELYHSLRSLDHLQLKQIIIESVPANSAWAAIADRLKKATATR